MSDGSVSVQVGRQAGFPVLVWRGTAAAAAVVVDCRACWASSPARISAAAQLEERRRATARSTTCPCQLRGCSQAALKEPMQQSSVCHPPSRAAQCVLERQAAEGLLHQARVGCMEEDVVAVAQEA